MYKLLIIPLVAGLSLLGVFGSMPSTTNFQLQSYGFGSGGTANSSTTSYSLEGITGEVSGQTGTTANYNTKPGYIETQQANVPKVTLSNPSTYYDKLLFVIDQQNNPTDAKYALQVKVNDAGCDFTTGTIRYVKSDDTLGTTLTTADYLTYAGWGSGSGTTIIGLSPSTTYCIRAKATQGLFTESGYGPSTSAATSAQSISFCLYTNANCGAGGSTIAFGALLPVTVTNSPSNIGIDFATNADNGGNVYIYSQNGGLKSTLRSYTINSATADITSTEGFGAQISSASQTTGGPLNKVSPYNNSGNNVGILNPTVRSLLTSANPLTGGTASVLLKTYISYTAPPATDYSELITVVAAAQF